MAVKKPNLTVSRRTALKRISDRMATGDEFIGRRPGSVDSLARLAEEVDAWSSETVEMLGSIVSSNVLAHEYEACMDHPKWTIGNKDVAEERDRLRFEISEGLTTLESIRKRVEWLDEVDLPVRNGKPRLDSSRVFIVHGHDRASLHMVESFLMRLKLDPVILSAETNAGKTIIEKFEAESSNVSYAIVLLTPDDKAAPVSSPRASHFRARQNVVFELGYFVAKLGRQRVCPLYKPDVELPSDFHGVVYVPLDENEGWKHRLAKEMRRAGLRVDLNQV